MTAGPTFTRTASRPSRVRAFTLIELLIVVAIIAILAAIAVPNFLESQTRSRVSRVAADMRTLATALETYRVDWNNYPPSVPNVTIGELAGLTTPVSYIGSVPRDPFLPPDPNGVVFDDNAYDYVRFRMETEPSVVMRVSGTVASANDSHWFVVSPGPDFVQEANYLAADIPDWSFVAETYDPTNGTISDGDIFRLGGGA